MKKYFVTYEQALGLKELGFDEECIKGFYNKEELFTTVSTPVNFNNKKQLGELLSAPLKSQVFEWARKEYRIISVIDFYCDNDEWEDTMYEVRISEFKHFKTHDSFVQSEYKSYEEAELACIDKLIEIIKTK